MLTIYGTNSANPCDGVSRREFPEFDAPGMGGGHCPG